MSPVEYGFPNGILSRGRSSSGVRRPRAARIGVIFVSWALNGSVSIDHVCGGLGLQVEEKRTRLLRTLVQQGETCIGVDGANGGHGLVSRSEGC